MRNVVWALNFGFALIFLILILFLFLIRRTLPPRSSLVPPAVQLVQKKPVAAVDVRRIYENDLFRTYIPPLKPIVPEEVTFQVPPAPPLKMPPPIMPPRIQFLDPLALSVKGIIVSTDEKNNRAIIANEKTKKEEMYSIGDAVDDAEILKIDRNKVIFVRSNGQQETIFLSEKEAAKDPLFNKQLSWKDIVTKISAVSFAVDVNALKDRISNLAQFIDMLDLTTATENGSPVGVVIGSMPSDSIGHELGLQTDDIIMSVNNIPLHSTKERVQAFQAIQSLPPTESIIVKIQRNKRPYTLTYTAKAESDENQNQNQEIRKNNQIMEFASPENMGLIKKIDKAAMSKFGGKASMLTRGAT